MKLIIPVHSVIDVITNSSTEIFTDFSNSVEPCKELINEMLKTFGVEDLTSDDIFDITVGYNDDERVKEYEDDGYDEETIESYMSEDSPKVLFIESKDPKYDPLATKIYAFLNSGEEKEFNC